METPSPPLPVQQPAGKFIDRRALIAQRHVFPAPATAILALPAFPALFVSFKAKRALRTPASAIPTRRRNPVVILSSTVAVFADRHISFGFCFFVGRAPVGKRAPPTSRVSLPNHQPAAIPRPWQQPRRTPPPPPNTADKSRTTTQNP